MPVSLSASLWPDLSHYLSMVDCSPTLADPCCGRVCALPHATLFIPGVGGTHLSMTFSLGRRWRYDT